MIYYLLLFAYFVFIFFALGIEKRIEEHLVWNNGTCKECGTKWILKRFDSCDHSFYRCCCSEKHRKVFFYRNYEKSSPKEYKKISDKIMKDTKKIYPDYNNW